MWTLGTILYKKCLALGMCSSVALQRAEETLAVLTAVLVKIPFVRNITMCVPTFRGAKLLHLQINPRRDQPALSQQVGYSRDTQNKLSETWVGFTCSSLHGVTCHRSLFGQYAFSNRSRHAPGLTHYQFNAYQELLFSGQKWTGHEIDGMPELRAEVKNTYSCVEFRFYHWVFCSVRNWGRNVVRKLVQVTVCSNVAPFN